MKKQGKMPSLNNDDSSTAEIKDMVKWGMMISEVY